MKNEGIQPPAQQSPSTTSQPDQRIHLQLVLPNTRVGIGVFSIDPVEHFLGGPIESFLQPAITGPVQQRRLPTGGLANLYPLALPPNMGLSISLRQFGELGFFNHEGLLRLVTPVGAADWLQRHLGNLVVSGPVTATDSTGMVQVAHTWIQLQRGMRFGIPISQLGEVALEVL